MIFPPGELAGKRHEFPSTTRPLRAFACLYPNHHSSAEPPSASNSGLGNHPFSPPSQKEFLPHLQAQEMVNPPLPNARPGSSRLHGCPPNDGRRFPLFLFQGSPRGACSRVGPLGKHGNKDGKRTQDQEGKGAGSFSGICKTLVGKSPGRH